MTESEPEAVWPTGAGFRGPESAESQTLAWKQRGYCKTMDPEVFFAEGRGNLGSIQYAKSICANKCPVQDECREYAMEFNIDHGVWGGLSTNQRTKLRRKRKAEEASEEDLAA